MKQLTPTQPKVRVGAHTPSKPRRVPLSDPVLSTFLMVCTLASLLIVPGIVIILVVVIGWKVPIVLGAAFILFVAIQWLRNCIAERRTRSH